MSTHVNYLRLDMQGILFNTFVHVWMYYYYAVTQVGIVPWWKRYLTLLQIVQFVTSILLALVFTYFHFSGSGCRGWSVFIIRYIPHSPLEGISFLHNLLFRCTAPFSMPRCYFCSQISMPSHTNGPANPRPSERSIKRREKPRSKLHYSNRVSSTINSYL